MGLGSLLETGDWRLVLQSTDSRIKRATHTSLATFRPEGAVQSTEGGVQNTEYSVHNRTRIPYSVLYMPLVSH